MPRRERLPRFCVCACKLALALALAGSAISVFAQAQAPMASPPSIDPSSAAPPLFANSVPPDPGQLHMLHEMAKERNMIRQKQIVSDTDQLLELAKELKAAVDKSSKDQLSLSVVNTAAEIEKLAKTVKDKMRDGQ